MAYFIGQRVTIRGTFRNADEQTVDPTAVFADYKDPSGNITTLTYGVDDALMRDEIGEYRAEIDIDEGRRWHYRFYGTGAAQAAAEKSFIVNESSF